MERRHIQNESEATLLIPHWGYADRVYPCTSDTGTCEYLDAVYWMHDVSMLYTFIMWIALAGIFALWIMLRFMKPARIATESKTGEKLSLSTSDSIDNAFYRGTRAFASSTRHYLLPESPIRFFGHVTRLQLLILAILVGYLAIFSFVGIVYKTWITPVKNTSLFNIRTGLGGFSDRVGALAYALTPLTVLLSSRESLLTLMTGISYQHFTFLHRWCGRIIFIQAAVHTIAWTLVEGKLYQPQPTLYREFIKEEYIIYGCVAMALLSFLYVFSLRRVIQWTGYEFFRKTHFVVAALYIGACWGHWAQLNCWLIAALVVMLLDKGLRVLRLFFLHLRFIDPSNGLCFKFARATVEYYEDNDDIVYRLDFDHHHAAWKPGQHFFLTFPALSIWQSHPFTVGSSPNPRSPTQHHTYIIRAFKGETSKLGKLCKTLAATKEKTSVLIMGPYGSSVLSAAPNVLAIAGGTGISFVIPLAAEALRRGRSQYSGVKLIWIVRRARDVQWMMPELQSLKELAGECGTRLDIHIFVTRGSRSERPNTPASNEKGLAKGEATAIGLEDADDDSESLGSRTSDIEATGFRTTWLGNRHPDLGTLVREALDDSVFSNGAVQVFGSGPAGMGKDLRNAVAKFNDGGKVWRGVERHDVSLHWDDRTY